MTIISCDYLNLSLANEYVGDVTIPTQVDKYNQNFLQADQPSKRVGLVQSRPHHHLIDKLTWWGGIKQQSLTHSFSFR
jgi:hypothetical protein